MANIRHKGLVPKDDPMFTGSATIFSRRTFNVPVTSGTPQTEPTENAIDTKPKEWSAPWPMPKPN